ncbi:MAG: PecA family PE domain-processing aspartic protease [Candidatus Nanopelagicales bacterium]
MVDIAKAQAVLNQTWATGNLLAGVAAIVPQMFLAEAAWSLTTWQSTISTAQASVASTVGMPVVHELADLALFGTLLQPAIAGVEMNAAALTIQVVGALGAAQLATQAATLVGSAQLNGQVYAVVPFVLYGQNEITYVSVNGGPWAPVEIDSGSSALTLTQQYVGSLGAPLPGGPYNGGYGDAGIGLSYQYYKYSGSVNFGNGLVTGPSSVINVPTPATQQAYNDYQYGDGIIGVLGIGVNTFEGPSVTSVLPGELGYGALEWRFGSWGVMVLGPNPLPVRATVFGAPITTDIQVRINGGPLVSAPDGTYIDSGGVYGTLPPSMVPGMTSETVPAGTLISVYSSNGQKLLYSYTTTAVNGPRIVPGEKYFNTGIEPYQQGPLYISYLSTDGTTSFDIV